MVAAALRQLRRHVTPARRSQTVRKGGAIVASGRYWSIPAILFAAVFVTAHAHADNIVCTVEGNGTDVCDIALPNVLAPQTDYPTIQFHPGDTVEVSASGCAQTGGSGPTWKRYVDPSGSDSDHLYRGLISIPGATSGLVTVQSVIGQSLTVSATGGPLSVGYQDDDYSDNGYWSHDDGTDDQCKEQAGPMRGRAVIHLRIHRTAATATPTGAVYGQCTAISATQEQCVIDRPDVTRASEVFPSVRFCDGDIVTIKATGCVQTGGSGPTWKDYVNPSGSNSNTLYHGLIDVPGVTNGLERLSNFVSKPPVTTSAGVLTLGYEDDDSGDNGYWSHDDGNDDQCGSRNPGNAHVEITITHERKGSGACGLLSPVTGETGATAGAGQSETSATVVQTPAGVHRLLVTFNDQSSSADRIVYSQPPAPGRQVYTGASLMGWALSDDEGGHWTYGGKENPPPGWPVLWGDPAIAAMPDSPVVFLSNLAIPASEFTPGELVKSTGGACIYKSTDGGSSFAFAQCLTNNGHFYDGASLVATPAGPIYAAYDDITTSRIDVWMAPDANAPFVPIAQPFPNTTALNHPRLRAASDGTLYIVTVLPGSAATSSDQAGPFLFANRYANGRWGTPTVVSEKLLNDIGGTIDLGTQVLGSELSIRFGPQFSFDVGPASVGGSDALRFVVTRRDSQGRLFVEGSACAADLSACHPVPEWHFGPLADDGSLAQAFSPAVAAFEQAGTVGKEPTAAWAATFYVVRGATSTAIRTARMNLNYVDGVPTPEIFEVPDPLTVCSDTRGYWGDYNALVPVTWTNQWPAFVSFVSFDSSLGCDTRWPYLGTRQHLAAVRWPR